MTVKLYDGDFQTCARKGRFVLEEKGVPYERVTVDDVMEIADPDGWFRKISPKGQVPVLEHDGRTTHESNVIAEYVNEVFDGPALLPSDHWERVLARRWMLRLTLDIHDFVHLPINFACTYVPYFQEQGEEAIQKFIRSSTPIRQLVLPDLFEKRFESEFFRGPVRAYDRVFDDMERQLAHTQYLAGDAFSLAEVGTVPYAYRILVELGLGPDLFARQRPRLVDWVQRNAERDGFKRAFVVPGIEQMIERLRQGAGEARPYVEEILAAGTPI